jgi:H+-translocating NAD(P) transhydrogenase subunit beta
VSSFDTAVRLVYLVVAAALVLGLHMMNSPATAKTGDRLSAMGMTGAVLTTVAVIVHDGSIDATGWAVLGGGVLIGSAIGFRFSRTVAMTAIPQLVSLFNAVGGGAAAVVGISEFIRVTGIGPGAKAPLHVIIATVFDVFIGGVTFSGSLVAAGKLQGTISGQPLVFPGARVVTSGLALVVVAGLVVLLTGTGGLPLLVVIVGASLVLGLTMVLPIGGADMPVVISLLNAFTGTAVAMAGFVIDNTLLIIAGALVGASGGILTKLMADAMNRSIVRIVAGGFGTGDAQAAAAGGPASSVREVSADDAAIQLAYANKVIVVPGYGLAAAQAQHEVRDLTKLLEDRGVDVSYAIHPVAGRMPGHMNVLLAEASVPYTQLKEMEEINSDFPRADVALVIGANDVVNPAARRPGNAISGMPILDVDKAKSVIVIKRSMGHGYAGMDNELYSDPKTGMFFADAKAGLAAITAAVKSLLGQAA